MLQMIPSSQANTRGVDICPNIAPPSEKDNP